MEALGKVRRLLVTVLIVATFLGGYYLGQRPGSPDVFGWAQRNYPAVEDAFRRVADTLSSEPPADEPPYAAVSSQTR